MKVAGIALVLVVASALLYWFVVRGAPTPASVVQSAMAGSGSSNPPAAPAKKAVDKVRRVTKEERTTLAQQIETATAERKRRIDLAEGRFSPKPDKPTLEQEQDDVTVVKTTMKAAMQEVIPMLADCYDKGGSNLPAALDVVADLTLTGDPDLGTIVDANSLTNKDGSPVNEAFGACVQDTLVTLEMPPISEGDVVKVTYPFAFARDDSTMPP